MTDNTPADIHPDRHLGELRVGPIAVGTAGWSFKAYRDDARSLETAAAALASGANLFDTALAYTTTDDVAHSDRLVGAAIRGERGSEIVVSAKGGHYRGDDGFPVDGRPDSIRRHLDTTLQAMGADSVHLYSLHHVDPDVPIEDSVGAIAELQAAGKVRHVGLSNVDVEQLALARRVTPIAAVQNHLSAFERSSLDVVAEMERAGGLFLAYSPTRSREGVSLDEERGAFAQIAAERGVGIRRVILAWLLGVSPCVVVISGSSRPATIRDSAAARELVLTADEIARLNAAA